MPVDGRRKDAVCTCMGQRWLLQVLKRHCGAVSRLLRIARRQRNDARTRWGRWRADSESTPGACGIATAASNLREPGLRRVATPPHLTIRTGLEVSRSSKAIGDAAPSPMPGARRSTGGRENDGSVLGRGRSGRGLLGRAQNGRPERVDWRDCSRDREVAIDASGRRGQRRQRGGARTSASRSAARTIITAARSIA